MGGARARAALAAALVACAPVTAGADGPVLTWLDRGGMPAWSAGLDPGAAPAQAGPELRARPWYPALPRLDLRALDGSAWAPDPAARAQLLSFFAVWCEPCRSELPALTELVEARRERGLRGVAIDLGDPAEDVRHYASQIGLRLPVALAAPGVDAALDITALPQIVLVDARMGVRGRWSGFRPELAEEIARTVDAVLGEAPDPGEPLGRVLSGPAVRVLWSREAPSRVDALSVLCEAPGPCALVVLSGRDVALLDATGGGRRLASAWGAGNLRGTGAAGAPLLGFRPGGVRVVRLDARGGPHSSFEAPEPLLDLELVTAASPDGGFEIVAAGLTRLHRLALDGAALGDASPRAALDLAAVGSGEGLRLVALAADGGLTWLDRGLRPAAPEGTAPPGQRLVSAGAASSGVGLAPAAWAAATAVVRSAAGGASVWIAGAGRIAAFDLATGEPVARLDWPGASVLAAGDLDGDGADEIAVASAARVTLLGRGE